MDNQAEFSFIIKLLQHNFAQLNIITGLLVDVKAELQNKSKQDVLKEMEMMMDAQKTLLNQFLSKL